MFAFHRSKSQVRNQIALKGLWQSQGKSRTEFSMIPAFYGAIRSVFIVIVLYFWGVFF